MATLDALKEVGYAHFSTEDVARRANVSRGALTHQFPSRNALIIAAFRHLVDSWENDWPFMNPDGIPRMHMDELTDVLWQKLFQSGHYIASLEMMLAARIDDELGAGIREVMERWTTLRDDIIVQILGLDPNDSHARDFVQISLCVMRGIAVHRSFDPKPGVDVHLLAEWKRILSAAREAGIGPEVIPPPVRIGRKARA